MSIALADLADWDSPPSRPGPQPEAAAVEVRTVFRGIVTDARILSLSGARRGRAARQFTIGSQAGVDAPVASDFVPWASHPLVMAAGDRYVVNVTPRMQGKVRVGGEVRGLASFVRENGNTFALPASGAARLDCGATSFIVSRTSPPRVLPAAAWRWNWNEHGYTLGAVISLGLLLLVAGFIPADPRALSLDLFGSENRFVVSRVMPPVVEDAVPPPWLTARGGPDARGGSPARAPGPAGAMGDRAAPVRATRFSIKGPPDTRQLVPSKTQAVETIMRSGVLGVLKASPGSPLASILGAESALGREAEEAIGKLVGARAASAFGTGGLGMTGTGADAAGTGAGLIGDDEGLPTIGARSGNGPGSDRAGRLVGALPPRRSIAPQWTTTYPQVRGGLDKAIVRRVIRLHLNEIKYCYDQELRRTPALAGRLVVQFTITPAGQVIAAAVQSSTIANARLESCAVQAVRRWQFPQPTGGGLVMVSYPFVLAPAGG